MQEFGALTSPYNKKSSCNFWLPQNLTTDSVLLTRSLTDIINSYLTPILYVLCIIYCIFTIKQAREKNVFKKIRNKRKYIYSIYRKENMHISGPA